LRSLDNASSELTKAIGKPRGPVKSCDRELRRAARKALRVIFGRKPTVEEVNQVVVV
jgi:hypothetical protein